LRNSEAHSEISCRFSVAYQLIQTAVNISKQHIYFVGKWILVDKYIIDSGAAGHWLSEEDYEWGEKFGTPGISSQILQVE